MEVRRARPDELAAAGRLTAEVYLGEGFLVRPDGDTDEDYRRELGDAETRDRQAEVVVAVDDGVMLGTLTWCGNGSPMREVATAADQGEIRMLAVDPAARGRGVARALVGWCHDRARADGLREVVLCSLEQMGPAHALYGSLGYRRDASLDWAPESGVTLLGFRHDVT